MIKYIRSIYTFRNWRNDHQKAVRTQRSTVRWVGLVHKSKYYLVSSTSVLTGGQSGALVFWLSVSPWTSPQYMVIWVNDHRQGLLWESLLYTLVEASFPLSIFNLYIIYNLKVARTVQRIPGYLLPRSPIC